MNIEHYTPSGFALDIFKDRYAIHENETFSDACRRVANHIASAEFGKKRDEYAARFYDILVTNRFSCGGRIWRGSGRPRGQLLNCFAIPCEDSREGWGDLLRSVLIISGMGGGVGVNFSHVRPRGTPIRGTGGESTGSVSIMKMVNAMCEELREGGGRRSALLFCLNYDHPDIPEFLSVKLDEKQLNNANISVCIDDQFIKLLDAEEDVIFRWKGEERGRMPARELWNKIVTNAWESGDPGLLNIGLANNMNTAYYAGEVVTTNPCGEVWLMSYDCCCLGAINLASHIVGGKMDWDLLEETVAISVRFLDDVIDQNHYPLPIIRETCQNHRRIGLGVMGLHDMLLQMRFKYDTDGARSMVEEVMDFIKKRAYDTSIMIAVEKGPFHSFDPEKHIQSGFAKKHLTKSLRRRIKEHGIRNCALLTIAPTGTTSIVAGCSSGIEPIFQCVYKRSFNKHANQHSPERESSSEIVIHPLVKKFLQEGKSVDHFQTAHEIAPYDHLAMQAICQRHIDNSISKTINLPNNYDLEELSDVMREFIDEVKGITLYRDGSKGESPMTPVEIEEAKKYLSSIESTSSVNDCPKGSCEI